MINYFQVDHKRKHKQKRKWTNRNSAEDVKQKGTIIKLGHQTQSQGAPCKDRGVQAHADIPHPYRLNTPQAAEHRGCLPVPHPTESWGQQQQVVLEVPQWNLQQYCGNDKDYPGEDTQVLIGVCCSKEVRHNHLRFSELVGMRKLCTKIGFLYVLIGPFWHEEAEKRLSRGRASSMIGLGRISHFFLIGPELEAEQGQKK